MTEGIVEQLVAQGQAARERRTQARILLGAPEGAGRTTTLFRVAEQSAWAGMTAFTLSSREPNLLRALLRALASGAGLENPELDALAALPHLDSREASARQTAARVLAAALAHDTAFGADARQELAAWMAAQGGGVILCVDDAHLADAAQLEHLDWLGRELGPVISLLVVAWEEGGPATQVFTRELDGWRRDAGWQVLGLAPLDGVTLAATLRAAGVDEVQAATLAGASHGNPGFALGLAALLRSRHSPATTPLPSSFAELHVARVEALGEPALAVAQALAPWTCGVPQRFASVALGQQQPAVEELSHAGLLQLRHGRLSFVDLRTARALQARGPGPLDEAVREALGSLARRELESQATPADLDALVPLALPTLPPGTASSWQEVLANQATDAWQARAALEAALHDATGVRRLVLVRRLAELEVAGSEPERALATLAQLPRTVPPSTATQRLEAIDRVALQDRAPLDRWEVLTADEALAALELTRAEALSQLVRREETRHAFEELAKRLERLRGPLAGLLWVRWARGWSWFLCEILGAPAEALAACARARAHLPAELLEDADVALALLRAEEVAACSAGDFNRARGLVDEQLELAERLDRPREACLAWNARAILHFGQGQLSEARAAFTRSLELGRRTGWLRREAIALHNLALVQSELGEQDEAWASETRYAQLSLQIANHAGAAEAPLVLACVALARGDLPGAEALIAQGRRAAESNGWSMLTAWGRALSGRLRLLRCAQRRDTLELTKARNDLLAALETFEEQGAAWTEETDPAETWAHLALLQHRLGQAAAARETLERASRLVPAQNVVSRRALDLAEATLTGEGLADALGWFASQGFVRRVSMWRQLWLEAPRR